MTSKTNPSPKASGGPSGIADLPRLLSELEPRLEQDFYCFTKLASGEPRPDAALMSLMEDEGTTVILPLASATAAHIEAGFVCQKITLLVPSSLEAVGMMAAVAAALKEASVPCNVVAGYHHDHLFVAPDHAKAALDALRSLQQRSAAR